MSKMSIHEWADIYPWESEIQKKGFFGFLAHLRTLPAVVKQGPEAELPCAIAFFIQKDLESHDWWIEMMSKQIEMLQQDINELKKGIL